MIQFTLQYGRRKKKHYPNHQRWKLSRNPSGDPANSDREICVIKWVGRWTSFGSSQLGGGLPLWQATQPATVARKMGSPVGNAYAFRTQFLHVLAPTCTLGRRLLTKFLRRSSVRILLRVALLVWDHVLSLPAGTPACPPCSWWRPPPWSSRTCRRSPPSRRWCCGRRRARWQPGSCDLTEEREREREIIKNLNFASPFFYYERHWSFFLKKKINFTLWILHSRFTLLNSTHFFLLYLSSTSQNMEKNWHDFLQISC